MEWPKILTRRRQLLLSLVGGGGVWVKPLHIHGNFVWEVGGEGGIHAQRGYILNLGVSISVSS
jgi:hypothetical protein